MLPLRLSLDDMIELLCHSANQSHLRQRFLGDGETASEICKR